MKAIVLAAGKSTRTYPLTVHRAKPMLPLLDRTILGHTLDMLRDMHNIEETILIVHHGKKEIMERFGESYKGMSLTYIDQEEPLGTGHAVLMAEYMFNGSDDSVLIMNGDDIFNREDLSRLLKKKPSIAVRKVENPKLFGIFESKEIDGSLIATGLEEKPRYPKSDLANIGCYHLSTSIFSYLRKVKPSQRGEIELTDAIRRYIDWDDINLLRFTGTWLPIGFPWDLLNANDTLMSLSGKQSEPIISESVEFKKNVQIDGTSIIMDGVKLGNDVTIENSIIMEGAQIGSNSVIKDSIIGRDVRIDKDFVTEVSADGPISSLVKGQRVEVDRKRFGCVIGDGARIYKRVTTQPGVKIWPGVTVANKLVVDNDIEE